MKKLKRKPALSKFITNKKFNCYAIDGGCALHIKNNKTFKAISFQGNKNSFFVEYKNKEVIESIISVVDINQYKLR